MANDINDDAELIPNHHEAWCLANHRRGTSNLARAYIELREITFSVMDGKNTHADKKRLHEIIRVNDI